MALLTRHVNETGTKGQPEIIMTEAKPIAGMKSQLKKDLKTHKGS